MNELDFDKLLSIEDPIPAATPKSEPPAPTPPEPEVPTEPETKPRLTKPQRFTEIFCLALLVVMGISVGIWWRNRPQPNPVPPTTTAPNQTIIAPPLQLPGKPVYIDSDVICTQFSESLPLSLFHIGFTDDGISYRLGLWDDAFAEIGTDRFNTWLRLELTEAGRASILYGGIDIYCDGAAHVPDINSTYLGIAPYYRQDTGALAGWFIQGWVPRMVTLELKSKQMDNPTLFALSLAPPTATIPAYTETRNSILLQENGHFSCHAYTERIDTSIRISFSGNEAENAIWDGTTLHIPQPVTSSFAPQYNIYNVWLRIELTENGKELFRGSTPALDTVVKDRQIIPYCLPGSDETAGWFILARVYQTCTATLTFDGLDLALPVTLNPVYDSLNLHYFTTEQLVGAILADESLWEGGLPYPFSRNKLLKELLNRVDSIQLLLQLLDKGAATYDADIAAKAAQLLDQKELAAKLTDAQMAQFLQLTGQYIREQVYSYHLKITDYPQTGAVVFEDKDTYYIVAPEIPAEVASLPLKQVNCFIRIDLLEHTRQQYGDGLTLSMESDDLALGIRPYYDKDGLAGWFVYGYLDTFRHIALTLQTASQEHLQTLLFSADPILFSVPT